MHRKITLLIIHCSATPEGKDYTVEDIDRWHKARGYNCKGIHIGYHYVIYRDGSIHQGRSEEMQGAHVKDHNAHSIGVCYIGGLDEHGHACDTRTEAQKQSLRSLLTDLHQRFPRAIILGHRDLSPDLNGDGTITPNEYLKQCPCLDAMLEYKDLQPDGFWDGKPIW